MGNRSRLIRNGFFLLALLMVPPAMAAESPPCIAYAYTMAEGEPHYSMVASNAYVFGNQLAVQSNCDNTSLYIDGELYSSSDSKKLTTFIETGTHDVTITNDNFTETFRNVTFIANGQLSDVVNQIPNEYNPYSIPYTMDEINSIELWAGIGSILLSWALVTSIMWKIIKRHNDNNYCMEVNG